MISKYVYKKLVWIDLESPTRDEMQSLMEEYKIPDLVGDEMLVETLRSKVDVYPNLIYLILHFPKMGRTRGKKNPDQEVDFIIGHDFIITSHTAPVDALHDFAKMFEVNSILDRSMMGDHAGFIFFYIAKELYKNLTLELEEINLTLQEVERNIFEGHEGAMVHTISNVNRTLVDFKQAIRFHRETLRSFEAAGTAFFGKDFSYYLSAVTGEFNKIQNILDDHKEILTDLRETNDALLSAKTNDTIRRLTIMTFIMMPLTLITSVFGMNSNIVLINGLDEFFMVVGAMALTGLVMFIYFRKKRRF